MSLNENLIPLEAYLLLRSGRVSFELVPKAVMASVPILAAVRPPSFLAVDNMSHALVRSEEMGAPPAAGWR
jgi:formate dehydrogenase assembly factor FdhD